MEDSKNENELQVLTIDELRSFEGLDHLSDKDAIEIIDNLKELSLLIHKIL